MVDDYGYIQYLTRRTSRKIADGKAESPRKTAKEVEHSEQKNGKRKLILLEKTTKIKIHVEKKAYLHGKDYFYTWITN